MVTKKGDNRSLVKKQAAVHKLANKCESNHVADITKCKEKDIDY